MVLLLVVGMLALRHRAEPADAWAAGGPENGPAVFAAAAPGSSDGEVFIAKASGPGTTPPFALHGSGGGLLGRMDQDGAGVWFSLVPTDGRAAISLASCLSPCHSDGWGTTNRIQPGTYRLAVVTTPGTKWSFTMSELGRPMP